MDRCGALVKATGESCKRWPIKGGRRCPSHGGAAPQVRAAAAERVVEQRTRKQLARMDVAPVADPLTALAEIAGQVVAFKDAIAAKVNELLEIRFEDHKGSEQLRSEVAVFERALDRCERFLTAMAKLNIDERMARVSETQARLVEDALAAVLGEMGLSHDQQREARRGVASRLRVIPGGSA